MSPCIVFAGIVIGDASCTVTEDDLRERLCCEPTVQVQRCDIISRWCDSCDLAVLMLERNEEWHEMNVLGNSLRLDYFHGDGYNLPSVKCYRDVVVMFGIFSPDYWIGL